MPPHRSLATRPFRVPPTVRAEFGRRLRAWYRRNARDLPWRHTRDAYRILVSELMLQQTQVARVIPAYAAFLDRFPTLDAVAAASARQVRDAWTGLGYYARARHLHALARALTLPPVSRAISPRAHPRRATLPAEPAALRALPGIGAYTAGAVASFAYERPAALVDTNVARVLTRVFAPGHDPRTPAGRRAAWVLAQHTLPRSGRVAYTHNQALMELGALVCTARVAHCGRCPLRSLCAGRRLQEMPGTAHRARALTVEPPGGITRADRRPSGAGSAAHMDGGGAAIGERARPGGHAPHE